MTRGHLPRTLEQALAMRADRDVDVCAGGTDLMVRRRRGAGVPAWSEKPVLFLGGIPELAGVTVETDGELRIGATTTLARLAADAATPAALKEVIRWFAAPAIRSVATVGGNICNASPAADLLPYLYVRNARLELRSAQSTRVVPLGEFITGPGTSDLRDNELLAAILIPLPAHSRWYYRKVAGRKSNALSKLSIYAEGTVANGTVRDFRVAVGSVAPLVVRDAAAEDRVNGCPVAALRVRIAETLETYRGLIRPIDDQRSTAAYRRETALRLLRDAMATLAGDGSIPAPQSHWRNNDRPDPG